MDLATEMYDHIGVGFGPANLALCISLHENERAKATGFSMCFLEKQTEFAWHPALLLPGAQLQVSPLKDLATMRDPTSSCTFLNFLHEEGRLMPYINREEKVPSRREWSAYLAWAAKRMESYVRYGRQVVDIVPMEEKGVLSYYRIECEHVETKQRESFFSRNVSLAVGGWAKVPYVFQSMYKYPSDQGLSRVVHASTFLPQITKLAPLLHRRTKPLRFAIIGGGQSAVEILCYLRNQFAQAELDMIFRASALVPSDDSPFVNAAAFDPSSVSTFWQSTARQRAAQLAEFKRTNYSVVRRDLLGHVYEMVYDQDIDYREPMEEDKGKIRLLSNTELVRAEQLSSEHGEDEGCIRIDTCTNAGEVLERSGTYDAVFLGTGFERDPSLLPFVQTLAKYFPLLSTQGAAQLHEQELALDDQVMHSHDPESMRAQVRGITRDYRLVPADLSQWRMSLSMPTNVAQCVARSQLGREGCREPSLPPSRAASLPDTSAAQSEAPAVSGQIFLFGCNERTHGLSDSLMSMVAHRAGIVTASLLHAKGM